MIHLRNYSLTRTRNQSPRNHPHWRRRQKPHESRDRKISIARHLAWEIPIKKMQFRFWHQSGKTPHAILLYTQPSRMMFYSESATMMPLRTHMRPRQVVVAKAIGNSWNENRKSAKADIELWSVLRPVRCPGTSSSMKQEKPLAQLLTCQTDEKRDRNGGWKAYIHMQIELISFSADGSGIYFNSWKMNRLDFRSIFILWFFFRLAVSFTVWCRRRNRYNPDMLIP